MLGILRGDGVPGYVFDADGNPAFAPLHLGVDPAAGQRVGQSVGVKILEHPVQPVAVREDPGLFGQLGHEGEGAGFNGLIHVRQSLADQLGKIQRAGLQRQLAAGGLAHLEYIPHHGFQPVGLHLQNLGVVRRGLLQRLLTEKPCIIDDTGQGRFQIVGHVGDQLQLEPLGAHLLFHPGLDALLQRVQVCRWYRAERVFGQCQRGSVLPGAQGGQLIRQLVRLIQKAIQAHKAGYKEEGAAQEEDKEQKNSQL